MIKSIKYVKKNYKKQKTLYEICIRIVKIISVFKRYEKEIFDFIESKVKYIYKYSNIFHNKK